MHLEFLRNFNFKGINGMVLVSNWTLVLLKTRYVYSRSSVSDMIGVMVKLVVLVAIHPMLGVFWLALHLLHYTHDQKSYDFI